MRQPCERVSCARPGAHGSAVKKFAESQDHRGNVYLVFEYVDHDLTGLLDLMKEGQLARCALVVVVHASPQGLTPPAVVTVVCSFTDREVQCLAHQMFSSLQYLHERRIVHRCAALGTGLQRRCCFNPTSHAAQRHQVLQLACHALARTQAGRLWAVPRGVAGTKGLHEQCAAPQP